MVRKLKREEKIAKDYPIELILELTALVMKNNHFRFGDTDWLQLIGTAMGTPMACIIATNLFCVERDVQYPALLQTKPPTIALPIY